MSTYTVFSHNDSDNHESGLSVREAAVALLTYDSHRYDIRKDDAGDWRLYVSKYSEASTMGGRPLTPSVVFSIKEDRAEAEEDIFKQVVLTGKFAWAGCDVLDDELFAEMRAQAEEDDEDA